MNKRLLLNWTLALILLWVWGGSLSGCSLYDTKSTVQIYTYPSPKIQKLSVTEEGVVMAITSTMYYPNHEDFRYYIVLAGSSGIDFQSVIDNASMESLTTTDQIPSFLGETPKPSVAGSYLNPIEVLIPLSNFQPLSNYDFAAIAFGYNESYGRLYENNGWLYSKTSSSHTIHIPVFINGTAGNGQVLTFTNNNWEIIDDSTGVSNGLVFVFATNINNSFHNVIKVQGNMGVNPLGPTTESVELLPKEGYVDGKVENYFVLKNDDVYALKNLNETTYARFYVTSIDDANETLTFKLVYSSVSGENNF